MTQGDDTAARLLREAETDAERTVSIIRIAVAAVLLAAVEVMVEETGRALPAFRDQIKIAQISLIVLFASGALAWIAVRTGVWRPWMAYVTVTIDIAIVAISLRFNFLAAGLPGDYLVAFPIIGSVPIILAASALRLRPAVQTYTTIAIVVAFGLAAFDAGHVDLAGRSELGPQTAFLFGAPPNSIRGVMVVVAGAILIVAAARGRRLLRRAIEETTRRLNLGRFLPAELTALLSTGGIEELKSGRRSVVTLIFVDIRDSTAMAETLSPSTFAALLGEFRQRIARAVEAHAGVIDKFIGDCAFVVFGVPEPKPDDASRGVRCARAMLASVERWNDERRQAGEPPVRIGTGVHSGEVFVGAVGDDARLEFTVIGDAVNAANRIEQATKRHGVALLVSGDTLEAAGLPDAGWRLVTAEPLRGRTQPVALYTPA